MSVPGEVARFDWRPAVVEPSEYQCHPNCATPGIVRPAPTAEDLEHGTMCTTNAVARVIRRSEIAAAAHTFGNEHRATASWNRQTYAAGSFALRAVREPANAAQLDWRPCVVDRAGSFWIDDHAASGVNRPARTTENAETTILPKSDGDTGRNFRTD